MCFNMGPSKAEIQAMKNQRRAAEAERRRAAEATARQKREDISEALSEGGRDGRQGGAGRRSLLTSPGGGYAGRFWGR